MNFIPKIFTDPSIYSNYDSYIQAVDSCNIPGYDKVLSIPDELKSPDIFDIFQIKYLVVYNQINYFNTDVWHMINTICSDRNDKYKNMEYFCNHHVIYRDYHQSDKAYSLHDDYGDAAYNAIRIKEKLEKLAQKNINNSIENNDYADIIIRQIVIRSSCYS